MYEFNFTTQINTNAVKCRAFTLREHLNLLEANVKGDNKLFKQVAKELIDTCANHFPEERHHAEKLLVILTLRSLFQDTPEVPYQCDCGRITHVPINYNLVQVDFPVGEPDLIHDLGKFKLKFKYPGLFADDNIPEMIATCITHVYAGGEAISIDDLSDDELTTLYDSISLEDIEKIKSKLLGPSVQMAVPVTCSCGKSDVQVIRGLKEFFRIIK